MQVGGVAKRCRLQPDERGGEKERGCKGGREGAELEAVDVCVCQPAARGCVRQRCPASRCPSRPGSLSPAYPFLCRPSSAAPAPSCHIDHCIDSLVPVRDPPHLPHLLPPCAHPPPPQPTTLPCIAPHRIPRPLLAADCAVLRRLRFNDAFNPADFQILLTKRLAAPGKGDFVLPGALVRPGEPPHTTAVRALHEKAHLAGWRSWASSSISCAFLFPTPFVLSAGTKPKIISQHGHPRRDPRGHVISLLHFVQVDPKGWFCRHIFV